MKGTIHFPNFTFSFDGLYCVTRFEDGTECAGLCDVESPDQQRSAEKMGYSLDAQSMGQMQWQHDLAHSFVALKRGKQHSLVMYDLAHNTLEDFAEWPLLVQRFKREHEEEENLTGAFQTFWRKGAAETWPTVKITFEQHNLSLATVAEWANEFDLLVAEVMDAGEARVKV